MSPSTDPLGIRGTTIADKYFVEEMAGEGGFCVVYRAQHTIWRQPVAIKCFKVLANAPPAQRQALLNGFLQEGQLMTSLSSLSAAIVQARDVGNFTTPDGIWIPYMVLEWLDGRPLDHALYQETAAGIPPRPLEDAVALLESAAVALDLVHGKGIAHRDVKPANFFVMRDARSSAAFVKVLDFGIAKVMADHAERATALAHTGTEVTAFTPNYGAPEQFSRSHGATGPWTDVFAMALILIEVMRGGEQALAGDDYLQFAIASRDPHTRPTPRTFGLAVSDQVEAVFQRALAVSPADRFPRMGQFWSALHAALYPESPEWSASPATRRGMRGPSSAVPPYPPNITSPFGTPAPGPSGRPAPLRSPLPLVMTPTAASTGATRPRSGRGKAFAAVGAAALVSVVGVAAAYRLTRGAGQAAVPAPSGSPNASLVVPTPAPSILAAAAPPTCPSGMTLVPGGKFFMGSDDASFTLWQPAHKVKLDAFCIDVYEVTAGKYKACSDQGECKRAETVPQYPKSETATEAEHEKNRQAYSEFCNFGKPDRDDHPINCVSWDLADAYCKVHGDRLPTEAEWEYAARGSDGRKFPWGDEAGDVTFMNACGKECNAWEASKALKPSARMYEGTDGFAGTAPVGSFPKGKTKFGAFDVVGNVWEWTADRFQPYASGDAENPTGAPDGDRRAIRGGAFNGGVQMWLNPAFRYHQVATASSHGIGFRCARTL